MKEMNPLSKPYICFQLGESSYAISLDSVKEIVRVKDLTRIHNASPYIEGIMNLRGSLITVINGSKWLSVPDQSSTSRSRVIVVSRQDRSLGILVDQVYSIENMNVSNQTPFFAVHHQEKRSLMRILDIQALFEHELDQPELTKRGSQTNLLTGKEEPNGFDSSLSLEDKNDVRCLKFQVYTETYGIPMNQIIRVIDMPKNIESLPHTTSSLLGAAVVRDEIIPIIDMRMLLGVPALSAKSKVIIIEVNVEQQTIKVGLAVDQAKEILSISQASRINMPSCYAEGLDWITEAYSTGKESVIFLINPSRFAQVEMVEHLQHWDNSEKERESGITHSEKTKNERLYLLFQVGKETLALPAEKVKEILRVPTMVKIPQAPPHVKGVANVRGKMVTLIDLHHQLEILPIPITSSQRMIIIEVENRDIGFIVDRMIQTRRFPAETIQSMHEWGSWIKLDQNRVIMLCEPDALVEHQ